MSAPALSWGDKSCSHRFPNTFSYLFTELSLLTTALLLIKASPAVATYE